MTEKEDKSEIEKELAEICQRFHFQNFKWHADVTNFVHNALNPVEVVGSVGKSGYNPVFKPIDKTKQFNIPLIPTAKQLVDENFLFDMFTIAQFNLWEAFNKEFVEKLKEVDENFTDFTKQGSYSKVECIRKNLKDFFNVEAIGDWNRFIGLYFCRNCIVHNGGYPDEKMEEKLERVALDKPPMQTFKDRNNQNKLKLAPFIHDVDFIKEFTEKYIITLYNEFTGIYGFEQRNVE